MSKFTNQDCRQMTRELEESLNTVRKAQRRSDFLCDEELANTLAQAEDRICEALDQLRATKGGAS